VAVVVYVFEIEGVDVAGEIAAANIVSELSRRVLGAGEQARMGSAGEPRRRVLSWEHLGSRAYPRRVKQMFMSKSAPQPAIRKTPRGGTGGSVSAIGL